MNIQKFKFNLLKKRRQKLLVRTFCVKVNLLFYLLHLASGGCLDVTWCPLVYYEKKKNQLVTVGYLLTGYLLYMIKDFKSELSFNLFSNLKPISIQKTLEIKFYSKYFFFNHSDFETHFYWISDFHYSKHRNPNSKTQ